MVLKMKKLIIVIAGLCIGIFLFGGVFAILGTLFSVTFGIIGAIVGWAFKVLLTPAALVLIIIFLVYKLKKKTI